MSVREFSMNVNWPEADPKAKFRKWTSLSLPAFSSSVSNVGGARLERVDHAPREVRAELMGMDCPRLRRHRKRRTVHSEDSRDFRRGIFPIASSAWNWTMSYPNFRTKLLERSFHRILVTPG